jgi:hypothetical protein
MCPPNVIGTPAQQIKIKRGGPGKSGAGASGWKLRPAKVLARTMADMARNYRAKKR